MDYKVPTVRSSWKDSKYLKSPWLEILVMVGVLLISYVAMGLIAMGEETPPTDVFAVGSDGAILQYDGSTWSQVSSGTSNDLTNVWASSPDDIFASGKSGTIVHYNGSTWRTMNSGTSNDLNDVWGNSPADVYVVGVSGTILNCDGIEWSQMSSGTTENLRGIWGDSAEDVFAVGEAGTILHYDDETWDLMSSGISNDLNDVWGDSEEDVFVVGDSGMVLHYDDNKWTQMSSGTSEDLNNVWGDSADNVFVVGDSGTMLHYDGNTWIQMSSVISENLNKVWGKSANDIFIVGNSGILLHYDGSAWIQMSSGTSESLDGLGSPSEGMDAMIILALLVGFFLLSFVIALVAVLAGIGGGLVFTPIMLAFTPVDTLVVRATGLIVAMFSGLISTGPFMKSGLANVKVCILCISSLSAGAFAGAQGAIVLQERMGETGDGVVRLALGIIVFMLTVYFIIGGNRTEWPEVKRVDRFTDRLRLTQPYYETSLGKVVDYKITRAGWGLLAMLLVGFMSGFFGLGGGWAAVPVLNVILGVPLKVAAACSGVLLGVGSCTGIWPYLLKGAIIPLFAAPWLVGQVLGGLLGSLLLIRVKASFVRFILIGILFFSGFSLVTKGLVNFGVMSELPIAVFLTVLVLDVAVVVLAVTGRLPKLKLRRA